MVREYVRIPYSCIQYGLPLAADKEESVVLIGDSRPKKRRDEVVQNVKSLGIILGHCLDFK